jgi:hypothetical protein
MLENAVSLSEPDRDPRFSEGSLEFPDRMRLFDRKPFSAALVRAGGTFETNHLTLRMCGSDPPGPDLECLVVRIVCYDVLGVSHF